MAAKPATRPEPQLEGHMIIKADYQEAIAIPLSLASAVMPVIKFLKYEYSNNGRVYTLNSSRLLEVTRLTAEEMTAAVVRERLLNDAAKN